MKNKTSDEKRQTMHQEDTHKSTEVDLWQRDGAGSHTQSEREQNRVRK